MKRTASCELQGLSPAFRAAIPGSVVRAMYSFALVDTVQRGSAFRQPYAGSTLRRWQRQGLSQVNRRATRLSGRPIGDNLSQRKSVGDMLSITGFRMSDFGFRVIGRRSGGFRP